MTEPAPPHDPSPGPPRRRFLAILFSDLCGSTALGAAMEAEHYAQLLTRLRRAYHDVIHLQGGLVVRIQGDGVLAIFGYPHSREDDARRAIEAALELHRAVAGLRLEAPLPERGSLALHTGLHAGLVLLDGGDRMRGRFELLGNAPHIAERLSEAAQRDELLVSEATLGPDGEEFELGERRYLSLKGRAEPLAVRRVHGRATGGAGTAAHPVISVSTSQRTPARYRAELASLDRAPAARFDAGRWIRIALRLARATTFEPSSADLAVLRRAAALAAQANHAATLARTEYALGQALYALGRAREAIDHGDQVQSAARHVGDDALAAQTLALLGRAHAAADAPKRALALLDDTLAHQRPRRSRGPAAADRAYSLACKGQLLGDRGHFALAYESFEEALDAVRRAHPPVEGPLHALRSCVLLWQGRWEAARRDATRAHTIADRFNHHHVVAFSQALAGHADWMLAQHGESLHSLQAATTALEAGESRLFASLPYGWLADGLVGSGHFAQARRYAARALGRARQQDRFGEAMSYRALARIAAVEQRPERARRYLDLVLRSARRRGSPHETAATQLCDAEIALARNQRERAAGLLQEAAAAFDAMRMDWHAAAAQRLLRACT